MKFTVTKPVEIDIAFIRLILPVRYDEEDMPNDFPFRTGMTWKVDVEIDTGRIVSWPKNKSAEIDMKVTDAGVYILLDHAGNEIARLEDYVPDPVPGRYGDYVDLNIDADGIITNWPKDPSVDEFFNDD